MTFFSFSRSETYLQELRTVVSDVDLVLELNQGLTLAVGYKHAS